MDISCRVVFSSNKWNKKEGSPSSFWRKRQLISLNSSVFIENLPSFERARARARANHPKIDAQKGCAMQLNGITLSHIPLFLLYTTISQRLNKERTKNNKNKKDYLTHDGTLCPGRSLLSSLSIFSGRSIRSHRPHGTAVALVTSVTFQTRPSIFSFLSC